MQAELELIKEIVNDKLGFEDTELIGEVYEALRGRLKMLISETLKGKLQSKKYKRQLLLKAQTDIFNRYIDGLMKISTFLDLDNSDLRARRWEALLNKVHEDLFRCL